MAVPLPKVAKVALVRALGAAGYVIRKEGCPYRDLKRIAPLGEQPVIFDVGAHYGETASRCKRIFQSPTVYSFEPMPDALQIIRHRHAGDPHIRVHEVALSDSVGTATLHINQKNIRSSILGLSDVGEQYFDPNVDECEVPTTTIDRFRDEHGIEHIDLLKLDVQGAEELVLKGADRTLKQSRISAIYLEVWFISHYQGGPTFMALHDLLSRYGFQLFRLYDTRHDSLGRLIKGDAMFVTEEIAQRLLAARPTR